MSMKLNGGMPMEVPEQSLGDIIDKITILTRKVFFGEEDAYKELTYLKEGLDGLGHNGTLIVASIRLAQMNFEIWNLENALRRGDKDVIDELGYEEIGKRAIQIRDYNKKRVKYKNDINHLVDGFTEFKTKHRSQ